MAQSRRNLVVLVLLCSILYAMYFGDGTHSFLDSYVSTVVGNSSSEWDAVYATNNNNNNNNTTNRRSIIPNNTNPNETFSACLLVMDENFRLREWLSYHYHVLPLRHLVVATDPRSQTSPTPILQLFRDTLNMNIVEWTSDASFGFDPVRLMLETVPKRQRRHQKEPPPPNPRAIYLGRQRQFLQSCLEHFHRQGHTWTACIDPDEYVTIDPETTNANGSFVAITGQSNHHLRQPGVVMDYIRKAKALHTLPKEECIILPRRQVGAIDTDGSTHPNLLQATTTPTSTTSSTTSSRKRAKRGKVKKQDESSSSSFMDLDRLDTFRWRLYNEEKYGKVNGLGKPLVDVSALGPHLPLQVVNPHRIQRQLCASPFPEWALGKFGFRGNHYIGSWEAYSYRQGDPRKGVDKSQEAWEMRSQLGTLLDNWTYTWLDGFIESVGLEVAQLLLNETGLARGFQGNNDDTGWALDVSSPDLKAKYHSKLIRYANEKKRAQQEQEQQNQTNATTTTATTTRGWRLWPF